MKFKRNSLFFAIVLVLFFNTITSSQTIKVANFGYSGATMLKNGHKPYWEKEVFKKSRDFDPNIVIIHLGLNDQENNNWPQHKAEFESDYLDMIANYKNLPSIPTVIICRMTPTFTEANLLNNHILPASTFSNLTD